MAAPSDNFLFTLEQYFLHGFRLKTMGMSADQKLRTMIVSDAYAKYRQNEDQPLKELVRRSSVLVYDIVVRQAPTDETAAAIVKQCHLHEGSRRSAFELRNDVAALDHIIGLFSTDTFNADKVLYQNSARWLIEFGKNTGDPKSVKSGMDAVAHINNDFQKGDEIADQIASAERVITSDVSTVIPDRENYTDEERERINSRWSKFGVQVVDAEPNKDGVYETHFESTAERQEAERERLKDGFERLEDRLGYNNE